VEILLIPPGFDDGGKGSFLPVDHDAFELVIPVKQVHVRF